MKIFINSLLLVGLLSLGFFNCHVVDPTEVEVSNNNYSAAEPFHFDVSLNNQPALYLNGINGPIEVIGVAEASHIQLTGERKVESDSRTDAREYLEQLEVQINQRQDAIYVKTIQPNENHGRNFIVSYNLRIPATLDLIIVNVNGEVRIDSLQNSTTITLVNGNVIFPCINSNLNVNITNGQVGGKNILPLQGTARINTINGSIQMEIPQNTSAKITAGVTNGNVSTSNLNLTNVAASGKSLSGTLGKGEGTIVLRTINGSIHLSGF